MSRSSWPTRRRSSSACTASPAALATSGRSSTSAEESARLEISLQNSQLQADLLRADNEELRKQLQSIADELKAAKGDFGQMQSQNGELLADYEHLQSLHEQLSLDYETAKNDMARVKLELKSVKVSERDVSDLVSQSRC